VTFTLLQEEIAEYDFYLKLVAEGGEVYWSSLQTFTTQCGIDSAEISEGDPSIPDPFFYEVD